MPFHNLILRPITEADRGFLRTLYGSTREDELRRVPWDRAAKDAFLDQQFDAQHGYYQAHYEGADFSLVLDGEQPIGRLYLFRGPATYNLIDIALMADWRGRGIGSHLLGQVLAEADALGRSIRLFVEPENPARRLYERLGFRETGRRQVYLQMSREALSPLELEPSA
jgi:ribosomal protein S18 acetylase RimI-like enzyme